MRRFYFLLLLSGMLLPKIATAQDHVIISEIMYDTPLNEVITNGKDYSNGEYIELYNAGNNEVNLHGWKLKGGGNTEIYSFPSNTIIPPKLTVLVAYQHNDINTTKLFSKEDLMFLYTETNSAEGVSIIFQKKIILSNSGESVILKNSEGITVDSIFYDGNSNKTKADRLSADNAAVNIDNAVTCVSLHRKAITFDDNHRIKANNSDWITSPVSPGNLHPEFVNLFNGSMRIVFNYDAAGNRVSRTIILAKQNTTRSKSASPELPEAFSEVVLDNEIHVKIYPNPTQGVLKVEVTGGKAEDKVLLKLYSMQGMLLQELQSSVNHSEELDMTAYPSANYILSLLVGSKKMEYKIIKK